MNSVISKDGTTIGYTRQGVGPALILVDGALCYRRSGPNGSLAELLAKDFTVYTYDRRGRGESTDTAPFAVEREIEDLEALITEAGGSASVYGISSGAALALAAASHGLPIQKLAIYEVPFVVDDSRPPIPTDIAGQVRDLVASGQRGRAIRLFMTKGVNLSPVLVTLMRLMPGWRVMTSLAHTLPYDLTELGDDTGSGTPLPADRWTSVRMPALVVGGGKSPQWMQRAQRALAEALPNARHRTLEGQMHIVKAAALAPVLSEFFAG